MITIEKGIPLPATNRGCKGKYPFDGMEVGDSFFIATSTPDERTAIAQRVRSAVSQRNRRNGERYTVSAVEGGVRTWLVERSAK